MKFIKTFENHKFGSNVEKIYQELVANVPSKVLKGKWSFDDFASGNADSKELRSQYNGSSDYFASLMHDDYDDGGWGVAILKNGKMGDEIVSQVDNIEQFEAMEVFCKIVNAGTKTIFLNNDRNEITFDEFLKENPVFKSRKLDKVRKLGMFDK